MPDDTTYRRHHDKLAGLVCIRVPGAPDRPCPLFLPTEYQPKYAYPLVLFLHDAGSNEWEALAEVPHLSSRNYLILCPRGSQPLPPDCFGQARWGWTVQHDADARYLRRLLSVFLRRYPNTSRFYVVSLGQAANVADLITVSSPLPVTGLALLDPPLLHLQSERFGICARRGLQLFLATSRIPTAKRPAVRRFARHFRSVGARVHTETYPTTSLCLSQTLRQVNRWIIDALQAKSSRE